MKHPRLYTAIITVSLILFLASCSTVSHVDEGGIGGTGHADETSQY
ncbi:MAG: hypothetical protein ACKE8G_05000 [Methylophagaceae bacterium]